MSTIALGETATTRDLFFAEVPDDAADELANTLREAGTVKTLLSSVPRLTGVAEHEIAKATDGLLSMDLADLIAAGWRRYDALREAARRSRAAPDAEETVVLADHSIESSHRPKIDVYVDGRVFATLDVMIDVGFGVEGARALVRDARLVEIASGSCTVSGKLTVQGVSVAARKRGFDLPGAVRLRRGIPLLAGDGAATRPGEQ